MDEAELIRAIITRPADDTVRLVCADWLEERGEGDRAAFIRVQIELARLPEGDPRRAELAERELVLFARARTGWLAREYPLRYGGSFCSDYRRGFPHRLCIDAAPANFEAFFIGARDLFARAPIAELYLCPHIEIEPYGGSQHYGWRLGPRHIERLADVPELARLSRLQIDSPTRDIDGIARALIANPHLRALPRLHFQNRYPTENTLNGWSEDAEEQTEPFSAGTAAALVAAFGPRVTFVA